MILNYDKYMEIVPAETENFVKLVLKFLNQLIENQSIVIDSESRVDNIDSIILAICLTARYYRNVDDGTKVLLDKYKFKYSDMLSCFSVSKIEYNKIDYEKLFSKNYSLFCPFIYYENYIFLTPERIIFEFYQNCKNNTRFISGMNKIFGGSSVSNFFDNYKDYVVDTENQLKQKIENEFYENLSYELICYLNVSANIFCYFNVRDKKKNANLGYNNELIKNLADKVVVSLLMALNITENKLVELFNDNGIEKNVIEENFGFSHGMGFPEPPSFVSILFQYFNKYLIDGVNKNVERKDLSVDKVISNIFDREFTGSLIFEKLLYQAGLSIDEFKNKFNYFVENYDRVQSQKKFKKFYSSVSKEVIEFIEFSSKLYIYIKNNVDGGKCKSRYINTKNDIKSLSIFISGYFFTNTFMNYFKDNGIVYEKVLNELGLDIKKDEIEKVESNIDLIIDLYEKNIFGIDKDNVSIDNVLFSLAHKHLNKSTCIQQLTRGINSELKLSNDFFEVIENYNRQVQEIKDYKLEQEFFCDMKSNTIKFIKRASKVFITLKNDDKLKIFSYDDLAEISIYSAADLYYDGDDFEFLKSLGHYGSLLLKLRYGSNSKHEFSENKYSINDVRNYFGKYVFGGKNKNKNRGDIDIKDIYTNIFNKEINDSLALFKLLSDIEFDYEKFQNYDECEKIFIKQQKEKEIKNDINQSFACNYYFDSLSKIYQNLLKLSGTGKFSNNIDDIKNISLLLSVFIEKNNEYLKNRFDLLDKRGLNLENYLKFLNINTNDFYEYKDLDVDYEMLLDDFDNFINDFKYKRFSKINDICCFLFKMHNEKYLYEDFINYVGQCPDIIASEMETGEEIIVPLSKEAQLNNFVNMPISSLNYNITSISSFGRELSEHSITIADEFLKLVDINDSGNAVIYDVQEELNKLSQKNEVRLFFWKKVSTVEKIERNKNILNDLNKFLEEKENKMLEQVDHFNYLKKLIAVYIYRLNAHILELENSINNFEGGSAIGGYGTFGSNDDEIIKQILYDKLNDFKKSLVITTQQYQTINMLLRNHAITLSKISTTRNTTLPHLYIEMSIQDGIIAEQDSVACLNEINSLLDGMVEINNKLLDRDIFNASLKNNKNVEITNELSESIKTILIGENLIEEKDSNTKKLIK